MKIWRAIFRTWVFSGGLISLLAWFIFHDRAEKVPFWWWAMTGYWITAILILVAMIFAVAFQHRGIKR
jgi:hypothetical protein